MKKRRRMFKRSKDTFVSNVFFLINRINKYPLCLVSSLSLRGEILYLIEVWMQRLMSFEKRWNEGQISWSTGGLPRVSRHNSHLDETSGGSDPLIGNAIMDILDLRKEIRFVIRDRRHGLNLQETIVAQNFASSLLYSDRFSSLKIIYFLPRKNKFCARRRAKEKSITTAQQQFSKI